VPSVSLSVVRILPASPSSATLLRSLCCSIISGVPKSGRVNISSQWVDTTLRLNGTMSSSSGGSFLSYRAPCRLCVAAAWRHAEARHQGARRLE
jgi:hypothetical protein